MTAHGFEPVEVIYFNLPGALGWYLNSVLLRRRAVPGLQARLVNWVVPWLGLERRWKPRWGMALIAVGRKVRQVDEVATPFAIPDTTHAAR